MYTLSSDQYRNTDGITGSSFAEENTLVDQEPISSQLSAAELHMLATKVYELLRFQLRIERERLG